MRTAQLIRFGSERWLTSDGAPSDLKPQLVLYFGDKQVIRECDC